MGSSPPSFCSSAARIFAGLYILQTNM